MKVLVTREYKLTKYKTPTFRHINLNLFKANDPFKYSQFSKLIIKTLKHCQD